MSDENRDPFAEAQAGVGAENELVHQQQMAQQACNMAIGYPLGISPTPEAQMRLTCLQMASYAPDGAQAPPVEEVIRRARAYWRFIQTGE